MSMTFIFYSLLKLATYLISLSVPCAAGHKVGTQGKFYTESQILQRTNIYKSRQRLIIVASGIILLLSIHWLLEKNVWQFNCNIDFKIDNHC